MYSGEGAFQISLIDNLQRVLYSHACLEMLIKFYAQRAALYRFIG